MGQSLLLGELVDYFSDVGRSQILMDCVLIPSNITAPDSNGTGSVGTGPPVSVEYSTRDAYLAAFGKSKLITNHPRLIGRDPVSLIISNYKFYQP